VEALVHGLAQVKILMIARAPAPLLSRVSKRHRTATAWTLVVPAIPVNDSITIIIINIITTTIIIVSHTPRADQEGPTPRPPAPLLGRVSKRQGTTTAWTLVVPAIPVDQGQFRMMVMMMMMMMMMMMVVVVVMMMMMMMMMVVMISLFVGCDYTP
jgi:hypothetical protein